MEKKHETYNGWYNWDTWNTFNWLSSYELTYIRFTAIANYNPLSVFTVCLAEFIEKINSENNEGIEFSKINIEEIQKALTEE